LGDEFGTARAWLFPNWRAKPIGLRRPSPGDHRPGIESLESFASLHRTSIFSSGRPLRLRSGQASRRGQRKAAPPGERFYRCFQRTISAHPEEVPSSGTVSKGVVPVYRHSLKGDSQGVRRSASADFARLSRGISFPGAGAGTAISSLSTRSSQRGGSLAQSDRHPSADPIVRMGARKLGPQGFAPARRRVSGKPLSTGPPQKTRALLHEGPSLLSSSVLPGLLVAAEEVNVGVRLGDPDRARQTG
jgi:hypothetical protein